MHLDDLAQWLAGIIVAVLGWFINDRVSTMDKKVSRLDGTLEDLERQIDQKVGKDDLREIMRPLREDMTYIRSRVDQITDRK